MKQGWPNILAINQYYAPDPASTGQLMAEFCEALASAGARVRVLAGEPSYSESSPAAPLFETLNGVEVTRVRMGSARGRARLRRRLLGYYRFMIGARRLSREMAAAEKPDLVLTFSNPPFVGLVGARLADKFDIPFVYDLQDLYPNLLVESGRMRLPWPVPTLWRRMNRRVFNRADKIIVLGEVMKKTLVETSGVPAEKIAVIDNWSCPEKTEFAHPIPRSDLDIPEGHLVVAYTGNIGIIHGVSSLVDIAKMTRDAQVTYLIIGEGENRAELVRRVEEEQIENVRFLGFQPVERFRSILATADVCFVGLKRGLERYSVPSKTYTYMAAGKPILCAMQDESDVVNILQAHDCGWSSSTPVKLAEIVRRLTTSPDEIRRVGENSRTAYWKHFSKEAAMRKFSAVFEQVILDRRTLRS